MTTGPPAATHQAFAARLLPAAVRCVEAVGPAQSLPVLPAEEALIARAVDKRQREFATARACARAALGQLGRPAVAIGRGPHGAPMWPPGIVGSITHCTGYCAAAVAEATRVRSLGIDAEPARPLPADVLGAVASAAEVAALRGRPGPLPWDRLLFSAKESVYKTWYPIARRWLGFEDVTVTFGSSDEFEAHFHSPADATALGTPRLTGRWLAAGGLVVTAVCLPWDP